MGLSIHYSASLNKSSDLSELIAETTFIARALNWEFNVVVNTELSGIIISPPDCESLWLCFNPEGKTCDVLSLQYSNPSDEHFAAIHVKTGHAGPEIHKALIDMLKYFSSKYFDKIEVYDEGEYWQTQDYKLLLTHFTIDTMQAHKLAHYFPRLSLPPTEPGRVTKTLAAIINGGAATSHAP